MTAPPRYDLLPSSCVNNEVISFNRQLKKNDNLQQCENNRSDLEKEHFTKHGLHLNSSGKECIALRLATVFRSFSTEGGCSLFAYSGKTPRSSIKMELTTIPM
jgi:hypothetical protein